MPLPLQPNVARAARLHPRRNQALRTVIDTRRSSVLPCALNLETLELDSRTSIPEPGSEHVGARIAAPGTGGATATSRCRRRGRGVRAPRSRSLQDRLPAPDCRPAGGRRHRQRRCARPRPQPYDRSTNGRHLHAGRPAAAGARSPAALPARVRLSYSRVARGRACATVERLRYPPGAVWIGAVPRPLVGRCSMVGAGGEQPAGRSLVPSGAACWKPLSLDGRRSGEAPCRGTDRTARHRGAAAVPRQADDPDDGARTGAAVRLWRAGDDDHRRIACTRIRDRRCRHHHPLPDADRGSEGHHDPVRADGARNGHGPRRAGDCGGRDGLCVCVPHSPRARRRRPAANDDGGDRGAAGQGVSAGSRAPRVRPQSHRLRAEGRRAEQRSHEGLPRDATSSPPRDPGCTSRCSAATIPLCSTRSWTRSAAASASRC